MTGLIDKLYKTGDLSDDELLYLIDNRTQQSADYLALKAREVSQNHFGNKVFIRGLIEVSSYCQNDCLYCGIRKSNINAQRYLLDKDTILSCCENGYKLGFRTFVLQGGELGGHNDYDIEDIIFSIRHKYPKCAITLSLGEKTKCFQELAAECLDHAGTAVIGGAAADAEDEVVHPHLQRGQDQLASAEAGGEQRIALLRRHQMDTGGRRHLDDGTLAIPQQADEALHLVAKRGGHLDRQYAATGGIDQRLHRAFAAIGHR